MINIVTNKKENPAFKTYNLENKIDTARKIYTFLSYFCLLILNNYV